MAKKTKTYSDYDTRGIEMAKKVTSKKAPKFRSNTQITDLNSSHCDAPEFMVNKFVQEEWGWNTSLAITSANGNHSWWFWSLVCKQDRAAALKQVQDMAEHLSKYSATLEELCKHLDSLPEDEE